MFEKSLAHEQFITKSINDLVTLAREEHDYATEIFLSWYVTEQVEEEANANQLIDQLEIAGDKGPGLYMLDKELTSRKFVDETQGGE